MIVGVLTVELVVSDAQTLKDKRRVIQGLKQKLRNRFNVSVTELGYDNNPRHCRLGVAILSREARQIHSQLDKMVELTRRTGGVSLLEYERQLL